MVTLDEFLIPIEFAKQRSGRRSIEVAKGLAHRRISSSLGDKSAVAKRDSLVVDSSISPSEVESASTLLLN